MYMSVCQQFCVALGHLTQFTCCLEIAVFHKSIIQLCVCACSYTVHTMPVRLHICAHVHICEYVSFPVCMHVYFLILCAVFSTGIPCAGKAQSSCQQWVCTPELLILLAERSLQKGKVVRALCQAMPRTDIHEGQTVNEDLQVKVCWFQPVLVLKKTCLCLYFSADSGTDRLFLALYYELSNRIISFLFFRLTLEKWHLWVFSYPYAMCTFTIIRYGFAPSPRCIIWLLCSICLNVSELWLF